MIKLYGLGLSNNVNKVRYCLNYMRLDYEWELTNPMEGENQTESYLAISPSGKIPALEIDGVKLFESNAINRYLACNFDSDLYPEELEKRAVVDAWTDYGAIHVFNAMSRIMFNRLMAPMLGKEVDENSLATGLEFMDKYLPVIEKQLSQSPYLATDEVSLADINLLCILDPVELVGLSVEAYPSITKWRNELMGEDWYKSCYEGAAYSEFVKEQMAKMQQG